MYQRAILDNGLRIITTSMPHTSAVSIGFFVGTGSRYENEAESGVSHFIEHLCFRGTQERPTARDISEAIEGVGGILNGGTDKELTVYWCKVTKPYFTLALEVLSDMLLNSRFEPADMEKERQIIIEEINMNMDSPSGRVSMLIDELLWPEHSLGRDVAGNKESVTGINREVLLGYMVGQYLPNNTVISVAGDILHQEVIGVVRQTMGSWTNPRPKSDYLAYQEQSVRRLYIETREVKQAHLCLALPGLSLLHPKRFTLDLLNVILGEGMSSRLFVEIRDRMGLAYNVSSYVDHFLDSGSFIVYAGVEPDNLCTAIQAILEQMFCIKELIPESELVKAKELSKGRLLLRMEDSRSVAGWTGGQEILTGRILSVDEVIAIIDAISTEELKQLAQELIVGSRLRLAVVGPIPDDESLDELLLL
ncbi:M16 family metallopeptidase [Chloroflexota bacterium]